MLELSHLAPAARDLASFALEWSDARWDPASSLLAVPSRRVPDRPVATVRNSIWYAFGLLLRREGDDVENALRCIAAVLDQQYDEPGAPYHGTFARYVGEPRPPGADAVTWQDFDPNWRQFIGLGLAVILEEYEALLPGDLVQRIDRALDLAVAGEPPDRCPPSYSNIALMKAALMVWTGHRLGRARTVEDGAAFGAEVHRLFAEHDAFAEYNSPTYYGVNLYALGFWRRYLPSDRLRRLGAEMEAGLWRDIARFYHAGLRNLCGPYTRSYGMDMTRYTALVSLPIWIALGRDLAPFPDPSRVNTEICYGPVMAVLGADPPADVLEAFRAFSGPRAVSRRITSDPERIATAWLDESLMCGAESTGGWFFHSTQFHPVTAHWRAPSGDIAWFRLAHIGPVDAAADKERITLSAPVREEHRNVHGRSNDFTFPVHAPGAEASAFTPARWSLPGLTVEIEANLPDFTVDREDDTFLVRYSVEDIPFDAAFTLRLRQEAG